MKTANEALPKAHRISVPMSSAIHSRPMTVKSKAQPISLVPFLDVPLLELLNMDWFWTMSWSWILWLDSLLPLWPLLIRKIKLWSHFNPDCYILITLLTPQILIECHRGKKIIRNHRKYSRTFLQNLEPIIKWENWIILNELFEFELILKVKIIVCSEKEL